MLDILLLAKKRPGTHFRQASLSEICVAFIGYRRYLFPGGYPRGSARPRAYTTGGGGGGGGGGGQIGGSETTARSPGPLYAVTSTDMLVATSISIAARITALFSSLLVVFID